MFEEDLALQFDIRDGVFGVKRDCFLKLIELMNFEEKKIRSVWLFFCLKKPNYLR
jgi:hypothetical protein